MKNNSINKYSAFYKVANDEGEYEGTLSVLAPDIQKAADIFCGIVKELHPGSTLKCLKCKELKLLNRILLVDDDPTFSNLVESLLKDEGYAPVMAADGSEALSMISSGDFDVVLTDIRMPGATGIQILESLRNSEATNQIPIIAVTNYARSDVKQAHSFEFVISKPFRPKELVDKLEMMAASTTVTLIDES